jgi:hypothetical protein
MALELLYQQALFIRASGGLQGRISQLYAGSELPAYWIHRLHSISPTGLDQVQEKVLYNAADAVRSHRDTLRDWFSKGYRTCKPALFNLTEIPTYLDELNPGTHFGPPVWEGYRVKPPPPTPQPPASAAPLQPESREQDPFAEEPRRYKL